MLSQEQIQQAVTDAMPDVLRGLRREIEERLVRDAIQTASMAVNAQVTEWVKENLVPEVLKALAESKDGLINAAPVMAGTMVQALNSSLQQTITKTLTFTARSADSPVTQSRLEDVAENGRRFMVSHVGFPATGSYARRCMALGEVVLNGVPPAITATFTKIADEAGSYVETFTSAITTQVSGWKNGAQVIVTFGPGQTIDYYNQIDSGAWQIAFGTTNGSLTRLVGGRYAGNAPQAVTSVETRTHTSTGQILTAPTGHKKWTQSVQQSLSLAVMAGGATIASYTLGATGSGTTENDGLGTITVNGSVSYTSSDGRSASNPNWGGNEMTIPFVGWPPAPDGLFYAVRYSNTVYGFVGGDRIAGLQNGASKILVSNVGGRIGSDAGWHSVTDLVQAPMYASEHPVTGQIERSTTLVCWV